MKDNIQCADGYQHPVKGLCVEGDRDTMIAVAANLLTREGIGDVGLEALLKRLSFERLLAEGEVDRDDLLLFYNSPEMLLNDVFDTMLAHLDVRVAKVAANDTENMGRFERAYRSVISGRNNLGPVLVSGMDTAMANRLFLLFMSVMDHESRCGTGLVLQQRWMSWYKKQILRYDQLEQRVPVL